MKKQVFLSGPIRGVTREESLTWRKKATEYLSGKFDVVHALRGREEKETFTDYRAAVIRDLNDVKNSDILLVNERKINIIIIKEEIENSDFVCSNHMFCQNKCEYSLFCKADK